MDAHASYHGGRDDDGRRGRVEWSLQCAAPSRTTSSEQTRKSQNAWEFHPQSHSMQTNAHGLKLTRWSALTAGLGLLIVGAFLSKGGHPAKLGGPASIQQRPSVAGRHRFHSGMAHIPAYLRLSLHQRDLHTRRTSNIIRRSVVEREALDTPKTESGSAENTESDESQLQNTAGMGSYVQEDLTPEEDIKKPDGSQVALDDCLGVFDPAEDYPFINESPSMPPKWQGVDASVFKDEMEKPKEDADFRAMFGLEPDRDEDFDSMIAMMDKADAEGTRTQWSSEEVKDAPYIAEADMPAVDTEGCLDVLLGTEPDHDPELSELVSEMEKRGGIDFRDEAVKDAAPVQSGEPLEILSDLFTDPDPDEERDDLFSIMDQKNPIEEVPDFTPVPEPPMVENEQIILLRPDQIDQNGFVIDPVLLESDPNLASRQKKASQRAKNQKQNKMQKAAPADEQSILDTETVVAATALETEADSKVDTTASTSVDKEVGQEEMTDAQKLEMQAKLLAQAEARAKEAEDARKKAEEELAEIKSKVDSGEFKVPEVTFNDAPEVEKAVETVTKTVTEKEAEKEPIVSPSGYQPPVVAGMPSIDEVHWESEIGEDYEPLRQLLKTGEFREADDWTRAKLVDIAGEGAKARGWVYFAEVPRIPYKDMKALDDLWRYGTGGKFGYSRQREIYARNGMDLMKMYAAMDWVTRGQDKPCPGCDTLCPTCVTFNYRSWKNNEFIYDIDAKDGHLPLTSTLRGNKLLLNILDHPAIADNSRARKIR